MKLKVEDLRIGMSVEVSAVGKIEEIKAFGIKGHLLQVRSADEKVFWVQMEHLAEVPTPKEVE